MEHIFLILLFCSIKKNPSSYFFVPCVAVLLILLGNSENEICDDGMKKDSKQTNNKKIWELC